MNLNRPGGETDPKPDPFMLPITNEQIAASIRKTELMPKLRNDHAKTKKTGRAEPVSPFNDNSGDYRTGERELLRGHGGVESNHQDSRRVAGINAQPPDVQPDATPAEDKPRNRMHKAKTRRDVQPDAQSHNRKPGNRISPPTLSGFGWKPSGLTGWELYRRKPAISKNGKRSSKADYVAYYSQKAVERLHDANRKTKAKS